MTSTIRILHKRGEEIVVVEEEDTTREVKRLWSAVSMVMKQIEVSIVPQCPSLVLEIGILHNLGALQGIAQSASQR